MQATQTLKLRRAALALFDGLLLAIAAMQLVNASPERNLSGGAQALLVPETAVVRLDPRPQTDAGADRLAAAEFRVEPTPFSRRPLAEGLLEQVPLVQFPAP